MEIKDLNEKNLLNSASAGEVVNLDITGVDRGTLLASLHNHAQAAGWGVLQNLSRELTPEEGKKIVENRTMLNGDFYMDYLHGRPIKVKFVGNTMERADLYDRDNGNGMAAIAILNAKKIRGH